jgi:hypothetical protein
MKEEGDRHEEEAKAGIVAYKKLLKETLKTASVLRSVRMLEARRAGTQ